MKLRLLCLLALLLFVFSACASEAVKESGIESESVSESASEPTGSSVNKYFECILKNENEQRTTENPMDSVMITMESYPEYEKPAMVVSYGDKKLYVENRGYYEPALKTNMKLYSYYYDSAEGYFGHPAKQKLTCYVEPFESYTVEGDGVIIIRFPGQRPFKANVTEKIVVSRDAVTVYGADKEKPDFKDKEELYGKKVIFAE